MRTYYLTDYCPLYKATRSNGEFNAKLDVPILLYALSEIQALIDTEKITYGRREGLHVRGAKQERIFDYFGAIPMTQGIVGAIKIEIDYAKVDFSKTVIVDDQAGDTEQETETIPEDPEQIQIVIGSRFDGQSGKPYFLASMLEHADFVECRGISECSYDQLFDALLILLFKRTLIAAVQTGAYKKYITHCEPLSKPKGTVDFASQIKHNLGMNNGMIYSKYSERTIKNEINALIIAAYDALKRKYPDMVEKIIDNDADCDRILDTLKTEIGYVGGSTKALLSKTTRIISHPILFAYEELRKICRKILLSEGVSPFESDDEQSDAILFYIPDLWELYLEATLFKGQKLGNDIFVPAQTELRPMEGRLNIRPDYVLYRKFIANKPKESHPVAVFDAKFKPSWSNTDKSNKLKSFDRDDTNKTVADMLFFGCHHAGIIAPTNNVAAPILEKSHFWDSPGIYNRDDRFYVVLIKVPSSSSDITYYTYRKMLAQAVEKAKCEMLIAASQMIYNENIRTL
jgi:hypothetical protein